MRFRFRYRSPDGGELEVESLERLRALVQSGTVGEATLLYDVLTSEWAPARAHSVFRLVQEESPGRAGTGSPENQDGLDLGLTMSLAVPEEPDADEAVRAMLREREADDPVRSQSFNAWAPLPTVAAVPVADRGAPAGPPRSAAAVTPSHAPAAPPRAEPTVARLPRPAPRLAAPVRPDPMLGVARLGSSAVGAAPAHPAPLSPSVRVLTQAVRTLDRATRHWAFPPTLVLAGVLGLLVLLFVAVSSETVADANPTIETATLALPAGPDVARLVGRFAAAQASGFTSMVAGMDSLRRVHDVVNVPNVWLEGTYLADAPRYREVAAFWRRYQAFLADVQARDTALFRAGVMKELHEKGVGDAVLSMRLSQATREFERSQAQRADVYRRMNELAVASLELDALLVARADDILYDPALQSGLSREPVVEAIAQDPVLRDRMWTLMERIFASLEWMGGELGGSRDNVTDLLLRGVEASAY